MADAGFGSDLHRRAHVLLGQADDLAAAMTACAALARDVDSAVDHGDGMRGRVAELEQRITAALAIDPADHATRSRDYGRGFSDALTRTRTALRGDL